MDNNNNNNANSSNNSNNNNNRKHELELKRKKLEEFRLKKLERLKNSNQNSSSNSLNSTVSSTNGSTNHLIDLNNLNIEQILNDIELESKYKSTITTSSSATNGVSSSTTINNNNLTSNNTQYLNGNSQTTIVNNNKNQKDSNDNNKFEKIIIKSNNSKMKNTKLTVDKLNLIEIPSKDLITYSKETQTSSTTTSTTNTDHLMNGHSNIHHDKNLKSLPMESYDGPFIYDTLQWEDEFHSNSSIDLSNSNIHYDSLPHLVHFASGHHDATTDDEDLVTCLDTLSLHRTSSKNDKISALSGDDNKNRSSRSTVSSTLPKIKFLNNQEQQNQIYSTNEFKTFINTQSNIIEKALNQHDIFFDYGSNYDVDDKIIDSGEKIKLKREFIDERWKNRVVTCIDWSPIYPELILSSYENSSQDDSDGTACIWNLKFEKSTPEYVFNCSSWITSCCFTNFHPNLVIAGTYSGQIVMWDTRSNKRTPIQRSSLSINSHTNPVYCIKVVGSQNANNLLSISNDGRLCSWTLDNMNSPIETLDLYIKQTYNVPVTCMDFKHHDFNNFVIGTEDAYIHTVSRHGSKTGINEAFEGHYGPITGISFNNCQEPYDLSNIFISSSFDWSIKLWNMLDPTSPIYSFEDSNDYIYDVAWSPIHPALFAAVDGNGRLDLWNLINDSEIPTARIVSNDGLYALNKLKWSKCGTQIVVGDEQGRLQIYDINENIARPKADDAKNLIKTINELKQNYVDLQEIHGINRSLSQILNPNNF